MSEPHLYFLGDRAYVNGLTLVDEMLRAFAASPEGRDARVEFVDQFKAHQFVRFQSHMEITAGGGPRSAARVRAAAVRIDLTTSAGPFTLLLFQDTGRPVQERRADYDRTHYVAAMVDEAGGAVRARFRNVSDSPTLLRGIIEVNHQMTRRESLAIGIDENPSWAFMTRYRVSDSRELTAGPPEAIFTTKAVTESRTHRYTIRSVAVDGWSDPVELCFFTRLP